MAFWLCCCWIAIFLLRYVSVDSSSPMQYTLHPTSTTFDRAVNNCLPGVLATVATEQEANQILKLIFDSLSLQDEFTFWVGLKKAKNECVDPSLPLRGFRWTEDGSQEVQVSRWWEEPKLTCTVARCAALRGRVDGSSGTRWGLIPVSCKHPHQFICKLKESPVGGQTIIRPEPDPDPKPEPLTPGLNPTTSLPFEPPETRPATSELDATTPKPEPSRGPDTDPKSDSNHNPGSGPAPGSSPCKHPDIPGTRFFSQDPDNRSRIRVECWSSVQVDLFCSGREWRTLDGSTPNFTAICLPCTTGFQKDTSGHCVDINECTTNPCRHTCLNTVGSYSCICANGSGKIHDEDSPLCKEPITVEDDGSSLSAILIPVLIAVVALVVLVVVVAVTVKCCLMKRSKRRAMKKAEKMALKSKNEVVT